MFYDYYFFFSSRRRHTRFDCDWSRRVLFRSMSELFRVLARWNVLSPAVTVMLRKRALDAIGGFQMAGSTLFVDLPTWLLVRSEERRVGKECRSRWSPYR